jgi:hypothetical protein
MHIPLESTPLKLVATFSKVPEVVEVDCTIVGVKTGLHATKLPFTLAPDPVPGTKLLGVVGFVLQELFVPLLMHWIT